MAPQNEQMPGHPRDPFRRVDVREPDAVRTSIDGVDQEVPGFRPAMLNPGLHAVEPVA